MINHPIATFVRVKANSPACPCTGRNFDLITGVVNQVDKRGNNYWYFINGKWIKDDWILEVLN